MSERDLVSVVIPIFDEAENVGPLVAALIPALDALSRPYEVLFIDDGSKDGTADALAKAASENANIRVITFKRNFGQTAAMMAGIDHAKGAVIVPMDGDLQNDPADIGPLLAKLDEGYGVVSGWRRDRKDTYLTRILPSKLANGLISWVSGVKLKDYGCTLKAYRREVLEGFRLYGEMHRFVPIYAKWQGARITELPVKHHPRTKGKSKYGLARIFKVMLDLLVVKFLTQYETKPIYIFGAVGLFFFFVSFFAGAYALYLKFFEATSFISTPLPLLFTLGFITGTMCILMGLLAEVLVRIYYEAQNKTPYTVKERTNVGGSSFGFAPPPGDVRRVS
ncbi:MAG: glycosyltransferase family 2 protein [Rhodospirillaceae bacterium]|nr:glycosyltransferase family 2 protein [Rhodospirillaceae bacterium]